MSGAVMSAAVSGRRYKRATAANYERRRVGQGRWKREHEAVEEWLSAGPRGSLLDVPVGTGRFIPVYEELKLSYLGLDVSEDMTALAKMRVKSRRGKVGIGDVFNLGKHGYFDTVVCVRLLHLLSQSESAAALKQINCVCPKRVILTVRLADEATATTCSTTHSKRWFAATIRRLGWVVAEERVLSHAGWRVVLLQRSK